MSICWCINKIYENSIWLWAHLILAYIKVVLYDVLLYCCCICFLWKTFSCDKTKRDSLRCWMFFFFIYLHFLVILYSLVLLIHLKLFFCLNFGAALLTCLSVQHFLPQTATVSLVQFSRIPAVLVLSTCCRSWCCCPSSCNFWEKVESKGRVGNGKDK